MKHLVLTLALTFITCIANASGSLLDAIHQDDKTRICPEVTDSAETKILRQEAAAILTVMSLPPDAISVLIADCGSFAKAAMTLNAIVIPSRLANFSRQERLFVLAHEIGHLANRDVKRWSELSKRLASANTDPQSYSPHITSLSREVEHHADGFAARALAKMGVNAPAAATLFFKRLEVIDLPADASHPSAKDRVIHIAAVAFSQ